MGCEMEGDRVDMKVEERSLTSVKSLLVIRQCHLAYRVKGVNRKTCVKEANRMNQKKEYMEWRFGLMSKEVTFALQ